MYVYALMGQHFLGPLTNATYSFSPEIQCDFAHEMIVGHIQR
jgi:hypothetical protein